MAKVYIDFGMQLDKATDKWLAYNDKACTELVPICEGSEGEPSGWQSLSELINELQEFVESNLGEQRTYRLNVSFKW